MHLLSVAVQPGMSNGGTPGSEGATSAGFPEECCAPLGKAKRSAASGWASLVVEGREDVVGLDDGVGTVAYRRGVADQRSSTGIIALLRVLDR